MLTVAKVTQGSALGYADYLEGKAQVSELGDYYLKDGDRIESPGRWAQGANHFGLDPQQAMTGEQLRTLMAVRRPDNGEELRRVGGSGEAVAAIDAAFSAPKSVSAAWAVAGPELRARIEWAHETAVDRALSYATRQVPMLRRRIDQDRVVHEKAVGLVATSWRHTTARAVADQVPDPQLHSHVLLHAAVRRDGRLVAIDSRSWLVHRREIGAAYRTELARELVAIGFAIQRGTGRGGRYFEIDGIPQELLDRWSSRHQQVQQAIQERLTNRQQELTEVIAHGGPGATEAIEHLQLLRATGLSPKQDRLMATSTRTAKVHVTVEDLDKDWRLTALRAGLSRERVEVLRRQPHRPLQPAGPDVVLGALTEFDSTFAARDARAVALEQSAGTPIVDTLEALRAMRERNEILRLADGTGTTRRHRSREHNVIYTTERLAIGEVTPIPQQLVAAETERLDQELADRGGRLSSEQRAAIELASGSRQLVLIEGQAGTGKSTTVTGIARAHHTAGQQIVVISTAALAADPLAQELQQAGVPVLSFSTAAFQAALTSGRLVLDERSTVIHDEAALTSTREQQQLLKVVETAGARLIEIGDPEQNKPVGAGGLWAHLEQITQQHGGHVELTVNQRAKNPADRRDQALFRNGQHEQAISGYHQRDRVHLTDERQDAENLALDAAHADRAAGRSTIVIAQTSNQHLDQLNARAQAIRKEHNEVGADGIPVPGRPYQLHAGDHIQIRHTINHPEVGQLRNGATAHVAGVDSRAGALELALADGTRARLDERQIAQAEIRLAYVQHPFPAQGQTTDTAHAIIAEQATREGTYVALTRARQITQIYSVRQPDTADDLQALAERVSRTEPEIPSIATPLAHEHTITREATQASRENPEMEITPEPRPLEPEHEQSLATTQARQWPGRLDQTPAARTLELEREPTWTMDW